MPSCPRAMTSWLTRDLTSQGTLRIIEVYFNLYLVNTFRDTKEVRGLAECPSGSQTNQTKQI